MRIRLLALLIILLSSATAMSAGEKPKPAAELGKLKFFVGKWRCKGKLYPMPGRPEGPYVATITIKPELDGHWASVKYVERKTKKNPVPVKAIFWYSYDAKKKKYVSVYMNNWGARGHLMSSGWNGKAWVDEGTVSVGGDEKVKMRMTSTKTGKGKFKLAAEFHGKKGWFPFNTGNCRR